ncbi:hypothetical protein [Streptomyces sp. NPDC048196]|uniref:hypothetical protein n=1 Tax=Streptomyces sp. NPDC048196 TaxID=3154712 RepID=UPI0033C3C3A1
MWSWPACGAQPGAARWGYGRASARGGAYRPADLLEFLRRAGLDPEEVRLDDAALIEWRGGGPDVWT